MRITCKGWPVASSLLLLASIAAGLGQESVEIPMCGLRGGPPSAHPYDATGGIYLPSIGTLRALIVFASFPDDETPHPYWPAHSPPLFMQDFLDPDTTTHSTSPFNLTNYFQQMSLGQFHLIGDAIWMESSHSRLEYMNGGYGRANTDLLRGRGDSLIDFSRYDSWTRLADHNHVNTPDGLVDMIVMVWRFNVFEFLGEASLGYRPGFSVDGKQVELGYPGNLQFPIGSGITCQYVYTDGPYQVMQTMVHELGHWLLGRPHPYDGTTVFGKHAYWGMICGGNRVSSCTNAYEREKLGWIVVPELQPDQNTVLSDYVASGVAYKYHPVNGYPSEYFYIENHQRASTFDDLSTNPDDKGVWILHQREPYLEMDNLKIVPSDGEWDWENPASTSICFSQSLPVFRRGTPDVGTGVSHRDQIPMQTSLVNWMMVYQDSANRVNCGAFFRGERFIDAFNRDENPVFSPYSNPNSNTWENQQTPFSFEVIGDQNGILTIRYNSNPLDVSPARRYLGLNPTSDTKLSGGLSLAWGGQWLDGPPIEPDVVWSELQRTIGDGGTWGTVYAGPSTSWMDTSIAYDSSGTIPVFFRARVEDTQGKYSSWSNIYRTLANFPANVGTFDGDGHEQYVLRANFPNPFNPLTSITFFIPQAAHVQLSVFDIMGRRVRQLMDGYMARGKHTVIWDATNDSGEQSASGVYVYRLKAGSFISEKRMMLLK